MEEKFEELDEFLASFEEEGTMFDIEQYHYVDKKRAEKTISQRGLTKKEAWDLFVEKLKECFMHNWKHVYPWSMNDYVGYPIVSTTIDSIYGKKTVRNIDDDTCVAMAFYHLNKHGKAREEVFNEFMKEVIKHNKDNFFSGIYEINPW